MPTTHVLFEDVDPFRDVNLPITFRAAVDYTSLQSWNIGAFEAQGARGGWVNIPRGHTLWPILDGYTTCDAGFGAIEDQISLEIEADRGFSWDGGQLQAAE